MSIDCDICSEFMTRIIIIKEDLNELVLHKAERNSLEKSRIINLSNLRRRELEKRICETLDNKIEKKRRKLYNWRRRLRQHRIEKHANIQEDYYYTLR